MGMDLIIGWNVSGYSNPSPLICGFYIHRSTFEPKQPKIPIGNESRSFIPIPINQTLPKWVNVIFVFLCKEEFINSLIILKLPNSGLWPMPTSNQ